MQKLGAIYAGAPGCVVVAPTGTPQPLDGNCFADTPAGTVAVNPDHDTADQRYPIGSGNGINQLCQQGLAGVANADFARSSRGPSAADCEGLEFVNFARDGLSWFHFTKSAGVNTPSTGVGNLTQDQLRKIFVTGEINNWSQVGGASAPIVVYTAQKGSGTRSAFDSLVGGDSSSQIPAAKKIERIITENNAAPILANGDAANAIFGFSFGRYQNSSPGNTTETPNTTDALGQIDGITPTAGTIGDSTFPFGRSLYNVLRYPSQATRRLLDPVNGFMCRTDIGDVSNSINGKKLRTQINDAIASEGFVPLPQGTVGGGRTGQSFCRLSVPKPDINSATAGFTPSATKSLFGVTKVEFSEPVLGVSSSTVKLIGDTNTVTPAKISCSDAAGSVTDCTSAVLSLKVTPGAALIPGQSYRVETTSGILDRAANPSNPAASSSWRAATVLEENSQAVKLAGLGWRTLGSSKAVAGRYAGSSAKGASASVTFRGKSANVAYLTQKTGGKIAVYVDGKLKVTVAQYSKSVARRSVTVGGLTDSLHMVKVVVLGQKGAKKAKGTVGSIDTISIG